MVTVIENEKIRKKLLEDGWVVIFREEPRSIGKDWMTDRKGNNKICDVHIAPAGTISSVSMLTPYVKDSGFETLQEWLGEMKRMNPRITRAIGYLYKITKID